MSDQTISDITPANYSTCYSGQCDLLNLSTCQQLDRPYTDNISYDMEGCFSSSQLRHSYGYHNYQKVLTFLSNFNPSQVQKTMS